MRASSTTFFKVSNTNCVISVNNFEIFVTYFTGCYKMAVKRKFTGDCLDQYVCSANEVIKFKFVRNEEDIEDTKNSFPPEYTHQFFGESENIFGYIGLQVNFLYSACRLLPLFQMSYREKVKAAHTGGVEADDVYKIVTDKLEMEVSKDLAAFTKALPKESNFKPFGELISSFSVDNEGKEELYEIYRSDNETPGFLDYHQRMQTLVLWLIDAASYIDEEDEKWDFFILHQRYKDGDTECYPFVGYATVYRYYAYPCKLRPRISQMLVLPHYQKQGLGTKLLEAINNCYIKDTDVIDITVEDPSEEFVRIRDVIDSKNCQTLPAFSRVNLLKGFNKDMLEAAKDNFKINKKQARRVYEILRLKNTNLDDKNEYRAYRLDVKNRLNIPFQREKRDMEKLQKTLSPDELKAAVDPIPREQRIEQLEHLYNELEDRYKHVIDRLNELNMAK